MPAADSPVDVSVVIISYNTRDWLGTCLASIPASTASRRVEVIVVDNASKDGSADEVAKNFPAVRLERNTSNAGFARAVNQGAALANGKYVLLLNPDGYLKPGAIDRLVEFAESNPRYIIVGGRTLTPAGEVDPRSCWAAPTLWSLTSSALLLSAAWPRSRLFDPEAMGGFSRDHVREVDVVTGCLFLMSRDDWRALKGLDEKYFVYGEDADLCLRARRDTGRVCAITPDAVMIHAVGASSATRADKLELLLKGRIALVQTHFLGWKKAVGRNLIVAGVWIRALLERLGINRQTSWREVWRRRAHWQDGYPPVNAAPIAGKS
jgi:GT2 family glycosyltransferase